MTARGTGFDLPVVADGVREPEFDAIVAFCDPQNTGYVNRNAFIAFMTQKRSEKAQSATDILNAFAKIADDQSYVTEAQLRYGSSPACLYPRVALTRSHSRLFDTCVLAAAVAMAACARVPRSKLTPEQVAYCLQHMKPVPNNPGQYDYKEFSETVQRPMPRARSPSPPSTPPHRPPTRGTMVLAVSAASNCLSRFAPRACARRAAPFPAVQGGGHRARGRRQVFLQRASAYGRSRQSAQGL